MLIILHFSDFIKWEEGYEFKVSLSYRSRPGLKARQTHIKTKVKFFHSSNDAFGTTFLVQNAKNTDFYFTSFFVVLDT